MLVSCRLFSVCLLRRSRRTPAALLWFLFLPCFPGKTSQRESKREPTVLFIPPAASAATPLKTSVKGGTNGADGEKLSLLRPLFPPGRGETGGMGKKKCLPRHECAADILTLFPIAKPNMELAGSPAGSGAMNASAGIRRRPPRCCRHMPPRSAHQSSGCPPRMWMCRWCTVCPAFSPWLTTRR